MKDEPTIYLVKWYDCDEEGMLYIGHDFLEAWKVFSDYVKESFFDEVVITSYKSNRGIERVCGSRWEPLLHSYL